MRGVSWIAVVLVIVLGSTVGIAGGAFLAQVLPVIHGIPIGNPIRPFDGQRYVRILMIGEDDTSKRNSNHNGLSDTLVVVAIDTETKDIRAISIPRDTMVEIPGHGTCKINSAHVHGGPELTRRVVGDLLGVEIDKYIKTNTTGLRGLVDMVGGVYIIVDKDMHYTDRHGGLYINLHASPEKQLLNGRDAEGYVRFRHDAASDSGYTIKDGKKINTGRIVRQQMFIRALANRILSMPSKRGRAEVLSKAYEKKYIVSDLSLSDWNGLADYFKDVDPEKMAMAVLPGGPQSVHGASYWVSDPAETRQVVSQMLKFESTPMDDSAKVEVLNGSGVTGAARKVADKLREAGFDVARTDNAPSSDYNQCQIITHKGKTEPVQRLAKLLGCDDIREEPTGAAGVDVTIIVGRDISEQN